MGMKVTNTLGPNLLQIAKAYPQKVGTAFMFETEIEKTEVVKRTPIDKGPLRSTVKALGPFYLAGNRIQTQISAGGGPAEDYAIVQHEDLDLHHDEGQAKYVESVILESKGHLMERVARRIRFQ